MSSNWAHMSAHFGHPSTPSRTPRKAPHSYPQTPLPYSPLSRSRLPNPPSQVHSERVATVHTFAAVSKATRRYAVAAAKEALEEHEACCENELSAFMESRFDDHYGPEWRCFVGRSCDYARACVRGQGHEHVSFSIGLLNFLLFRRNADGQFMFDVKKTNLVAY